MHSKVKNDYNEEVIPISYFQTRGTTQAAAAALLSLPFFFIWGNCFFKTSFFVVFCATKGGEQVWRNSYSLHGCKILQFNLHFFLENEKAKKTLSSLTKGLK